MSMPAHHTLFASAATLWAAIASTFTAMTWSSPPTLLIPVVLCLAGWVGATTPHRRSALGLAAFLVSGFVLISSMTVGMLYVPSLALLLLGMRAARHTPPNGRT